MVLEVDLLITYSYYWMSFLINCRDLYVIAYLPHSDFIQKLIYLLQKLRGKIDLLDT